MKDENNDNNKTSDGILNRKKNILQLRRWRIKYECMLTIDLIQYEQNACELNGQDVLLDHYHKSLDTAGRVYLAQISDLPQESLFKHSWVHPCLRLGFEGWVWVMEKERNTLNMLGRTCIVFNISTLVRGSQMWLTVLQDVWWLCHCSQTLVSTQMATFSKEKS